WLPVGVFTPFAVAAVVWNLLDGTTPLWQLLLLPLAGLMLWSLLEYVFHSVGFHWPTKSPRLQALQASHAGHHEVPSDPARMVVRLVLTVPVAIVLFGLFSLAFGARPAALLMAGLIVGYLAYEVVHYRIHVGRGPRWLRPLVRHHLYHHYKDPSRCYGVTSPLWDWVFRTGRPPRKAPVKATPPLTQPAAPAGQ
ncbi:MAG TPA: sterol desaturase family protein, partial [Gemmataceae bacterium]|nr:sterol desaturase family protein [Gemmataceae bacterium]